MALQQLAYLLALCFLGSFLGLIGGLTLLWKENFARKMSFFFVSFAAGALLSAAFFDLLPEALELTSFESIGAAVLASFILFSITERLLVWHQHHKTHYIEHPKKPKAYGSLVIISDTIHNLIDGVVIAAALLISLPLGIITALGVFFHEIPQEIGDFSILLYIGYSRLKVIVYNSLSAAATFVGAIGVFLFSMQLQSLLPVLLAFTAGGFIYIAAADLMPELKHEVNKLKYVALQTTIMIFGMAVMAVLSLYLGV
jgi:zinc and cadmium transporter